METTHGDPGEFFDDDAIGAHLFREFPDNGVPVVYHCRPRCPICFTDQIQRLRTASEDGTVKRRMFCLSCDLKFLTVEE